MTGLLVTFALGVFVLLGAFIAGFAKNVDRIREASIAVALGAMVMLLIDDLIPEVIEEFDELGWPLLIVGIAAGVLVLVLLDRFLPESHHEQGHVEHKGSAFHISIATTIALAVHNIVEGMSVYSVSTQSTTLAMMLALGIGVHNIPMGMIVYSGIRDRSRRSKIIMMTIATLSTFVGGLVMFGMQSAVDERLMLFMVCVTIGLLLYIIAFELIPLVIHAQNKKVIIFGIIIGLALVAAGGALELLA